MVGDLNKYVVYLGRIGLGVMSMLKIYLFRWESFTPLGQILNLVGLRPLQQKPRTDCDGKLVQSVRHLFLLWLHAQSVLSMVRRFRTSAETVLVEEHWVSLFLHG